MGDSLAGFFYDPEFRESCLVSPPSPGDLFSILEGFEGTPDEYPTHEPLPELQHDDPETESGQSRKRKGQKVNRKDESSTSNPPSAGKGQHRMSHIAVERNRRKQMNDHLSVLRSLMPCFYVKRADQASIIGGVADYINELQQVLQSLEAKKQRKVYSEVLSPKLLSSPSWPSPLSPRKPPLSPRLSLPISPRTPQPGSPYIPRLQQTSGGYLSPTKATPLDLSPSCSSNSSIDNNINSTIPTNELVVNSKSTIAEVEVKFSGANVLLNTVSPRIPGQALKIISALEDLSLEILQLNICIVDEKVHHSFTIKIGIDCKHSAEELAHHIQQTFCS